MTRKPQLPPAPPSAGGPADEAAPHPLSDESFPIVGVGASAGGLEPFLELLRALPDDPGMAFVFILHQEKHVSHLVEVIARATKMQVRTVTDGLLVEPNHVYVALPSAVVAMTHRTLTFHDAPKYSLPIDSFFHSLADDRGDRAIGVILSGSASDGALGAKAIKGQSGITFAQDASTLFPQMAQAAISAGAIDFVMPPADIARELMRIAENPVLKTPQGRFSEAELKQLFRLLETSSDVDFKNYKMSTVERRIRRRIAVHKLGSLGEYLRLLREDRAELAQLHDEILIHVTGFFRDGEVFDAMQRELIPQLMREREQDGNPVRVWVPGCSTGEEVYSLAILLLEAAGEEAFNCPIQIFGTDLSETAVERARTGIYPENIAGEVSPQRLRRFFTKIENGYRVSRAVRDCCIFARQNVTKDPPFSRLDLVSCRNVMIYLGAVLQRKVMSIFHYSLRPNGYLLLGSSETIGSHGGLFSVVDRKHRIYQKRPAQNRITVDFEPAAPREQGERTLPMEEESVAPSNIFREADRLMLSRYSPPGVLINEAMEVVQFRGRTAKFLEPPSGAASFNVLKMAREGLLAELRATINAARKREEPVRREGVRVKSDGGTIVANIEVIPFVAPSRERFQIVLFEEASQPPAPRRSKKAAEAAQAADAPLQRELEATREYLQSIIEEQEAMNEELRSANEEIQSSNEELQSTNEELETAKEELQSSNEELTTLNEELANRNEELAEANNDLVNILASVDLPILMLDDQLRIRRFNPGAQRVLNLIPTDVGRSILDMNLSLVVDDLETMIRGVIDDLEVRESEVRDRAGRTYVLRIRPYRTMENKIDGVVMVLIDVDRPRRK